MKTALIILLLLVAVFSSSCDDNSIIDYNKIHSGRDGLKLSFLADAPPSEVFGSTSRTSEFQISVQVENKGASAADGYLGLSFDPEYIDTSYGNDIEQLDGKSILSPVGERDIYSFKATVNKLDPASREQQNTKITATVCYKYSTEAVATVCVDSDPSNLKNKKKVCTAKPISLSNQGAPVAVTKIEPRALVDDTAEGGTVVYPSFLIYVQNVGDGDILNVDDPKPLCKGEETSTGTEWRDVFNIINAPVVELSRKRLTCSPGRQRIKTGDETFFSCKLEEGISTEQTYSAQLLVTFDYSYSSSLSKNLLITKELS